MHRRRRGDCLLLAGASMGDTRRAVETLGGVPRDEAAVVPRTFGRRHLKTSALDARWSLIFARFG
jgi:hypothetical protein